MSRWQDDLAARARAVLPAHVAHYVDAGAREGITAGENVDGWRRVRLLPRVLADVRAPDLTTDLLGASSPMPVGIAPTSLQRLAHPDGELAMAEAARDAGVVVVVSSNAGATFADIGAVGATWWLQAYLTADRSLIAPALEQAAAAGASAVVLTVDTPVPGTKYDVDDDAFGDLSHAYGANHPDAVRGLTPGAEHAQDLSVRDLAWLAELTGVPVVVKGVLRPDDARRAVQAGVAAVWVSNHGGRQLDRSVTTAEALPAVAAAVAGDVPVYADSGLRSGLDILAALAAGADAAFLGRLPWWALAAGGAAGVRDVLDTVRVELEEAMRLAGCPTLADTRSLRAAPALPPV